LRFKPLKRGFAIGKTGRKRKRMKNKILVKLCGLLLIVASIWAMTIDGDGTFALLTVPLGTFVLFTRYNLL
jgi:hypothetical protein